MGQCKGDGDLYPGSYGMLVFSRAPACYAAGGDGTSPEVLPSAPAGDSVEIPRHPPNLLACNACSYRLAVLHWPYWWDGRVLFLFA